MVFVGCCSLRVACRFVRCIGCRVWFVVWCFLVFVFRCLFVVCCLLRVVCLLCVVVLVLVDRCSLRVVV